jgi:hypothetical protein
MLLRHPSGSGIVIELPRSTEFGRKIPKQRFYDNITVTPQLKRVFVEQIEQITWRNKIAPTTTNIAEGKAVKEIEIFAVKLNQRSLDTKVLSQIDKEIPYHILFLLEYKDEVQAWIGYKEESQSKPGTFKPGVYYNTEWMPFSSLPLKLDGLNMDTVYEGLIRQIAGDRLVPDDTPDVYDIKGAIDRDVQRQKLEKEISALAKKVQGEKQFNRQVALNEELKRLRAELEGLAWN